MAATGHPRDPCARAASPAARRDPAVPNVLGGVPARTHRPRVSNRGQAVVDRPYRASGLGPRRSRSRHVVSLTHATASPLAATNAASRTPAPASTSPTASNRRGSSLRGRRTTRATRRRRPGRPRHRALAGRPARRTPPRPGYHCVRRQHEEAAARLFHQVARRVRPAGALCRAAGLGLGRHCRRASASRRRAPG